MDEQKIRQIVRDEMAKQNTQNMYGVSNIPIHTHNGTDSVKIPISSAIESVAISGKGNSVFSPTVLTGQTINNFNTASINPPTAYVLPINIIYGFGTGVHSAFNGGDAPDGTMVFFDNGLSLSQLWIKTANNWYGISCDMIE